LCTENLEFVNLAIPVIAGPRVVKLTTHAENLVNVWTPPNSDYHSRTLQMHPCDYIFRVSCMHQ